MVRVNSRRGRRPAVHYRAFLALIVAPCLALALVGWLGVRVASGAEQADEKSAERHVIVVTLDGFRRQEFFTGAEAGLIDPRFGGVKEPAEVHKKYWRETAEERRAVLLPFLWGELVRQGQIFGDPSRNAPCRLTNGLKFSYPGYNELFAGKADPRIDSNAKKNNPNLTVLEFLHRQPAFAGRVAVYCTWDVFPFVFRAETSGLPVHAAWTPLRDEPLTPGQRRINELLEQFPRYWPSVSYDWFAMEAAREHVAKHRPRALYVGLGETDEWAHGRRYDLYLDAARRSDRFLAEFWHTLQSMPEYRGRTTLIVTTDHGRGGDRDSWVNHDRNTENAEYIWLAVLGPDTPALGVRHDVETTQSQVAATIARAVGADFQSAVPEAAAPLPGVFK